MNVLNDELCDPHYRQLHKVTHEEIYHGPETLPKLGGVTLPNVAQEVTIRAIVAGTCQDCSSRHALFDTDDSRRLSYQLEEEFRIQQESEWTDFEVKVACECCKR